MVSSPKIVLFDLETLPNLPEALKIWPSLSDFPFNTGKASVTTIICAGWKLLGQRQVNCINAWDFSTWKKDVNDDRLLCEKIYEVLKDADCVVTHNGKRFDWKFLQSRLRKHKLPPLPKIHHVDTCVEAKRNFLLVNNRLNTVARFLTDQEKMDHEGWDLWVKVHGRDPEAMKRMSLYCMQDVIALEAVFEELRPVITSLPNYNLFSPLKAKSCPNCGSSRLESRGYRHTKTARFHRYVCKDCYTWSSTDKKDEVPR